MSGDFYSYRAVLADKIEQTIDGTQFEPLISNEDWHVILNALRGVGNDGPNVPEGWKLVPIKPTDAMIEAQFKCWHDENGGKEAYVAQMYTAMVEACPPFATNEKGSNG